MWYHSSVPLWGHSLYYLDYVKQSSTGPILCYCHFSYPAAGRKCNRTEDFGRLHRAFQLLGTVLHHLFGGLFGFVGMIIAVPLWAVILNSIRRYANKTFREEANSESSGIL